MNSLTCQQLAEHIGASWVGDGSRVLTRIEPISRAQISALTFINHPRFLGDLKKTQATAAIVRAEWVADCPCVSIVSDDPYRDYAKATGLFYPPKREALGRHPSAIIASTAQLGDEVAIGAQVSIGDYAVIGKNVSIGAGCRIGNDVVIGDGTRLHANVVIESECIIGRNCHIQAGAIIGSDGFGYARDREQWIPIQQIGRVVIGECVEIGANTTIDRGAMDDTTIADGVILDNQIQIAHNVKIGALTAIAGCAAVAGSTSIGRRCSIGGSTVVLGHITIADDTIINAMSLVTSSIDQPGRYASSLPVMASSAWNKNIARLRKLDTLMRKVDIMSRSFCNNQSSDQ